MKELGIQTKVSLKKMYYDALVEAGKIKDILTKKQIKKVPTLRVGKNGSILLSKALLVDQLGFKEGDEFKVVKRRDSIIPKKNGVVQMLSGECEYEISTTRKSTKEDLITNVKNEIIKRNDLDTNFINMTEDKIIRWLIDVYMKRSGKQND